MLGEEYGVLRSRSDKHSNAIIVNAFPSNPSPPTNDLTRISKICPFLSNKYLYDLLNILFAFFNKLYTTSKNLQIN